MVYNIKGFTQVGLTFFDILLELSLIDGAKHLNKY